MAMDIFRYNREFFFFLLLNFRIGVTVETSSRSPIPFTRIPTYTDAGIDANRKINRGQGVCARHPCKSVLSPLNESNVGPDVNEFRSNCNYVPG